MSEGPHLDGATAIGIIELLGPGAHAALIHVASCPDCRGRLEDAAAVAAAIRPDETVRPGFAEEVMAALPARDRPAAGRWTWGVATGGLVGAAAASFLVAADAGAGAAPMLTAGLAVVVGLVAAAVAISGRGIPSGV